MRPSLSRFAFAKRFLGDGSEENCAGSTGGQDVFVSRRTLGVLEEIDFSVPPLLERNLELDPTRAECEPPLEPGGSMDLRDGALKRVGEDDTTVGGDVPTVPWARGGWNRCRRCGGT